MKHNPLLPSLLSRSLGILGGGQLARMLALSAHSLGIKTHILSPLSTDPAAQVVRHHHQAELDDIGAIKEFVRRCSVITFETENLPETTWNFLMDHSQSISSYPQAKTMYSLSRRHTQKALLKAHHLPQTDYVLLTENLLDPSAIKTYLLKHLSLPAILKTTQGGYDGRGTYRIEEHSDHKALHDFLSTYTSTPLLAEKYIPFERELAFSIARNAQGDIHLLPLVETQQTDFQCHWVKGGIEIKGALKDHFEKLVRLCSNMLREISYVGIIAFELFELKDHSLLINEVAPRVHNSAHYSMDALHYSQFDLHIMSLFDLPLPKHNPLISPGFAMANLIGGGVEKPHIVQRENTFLHWYGKTENRLQRKMGHINALGCDANQALEIALKAKNSLRL